MPYLPYIDQSDMTSSQKKVIVPALYFTTLAFVGLLIFASFNYY